MSKHPLKHYVYISDTKVDMLYAQIPRPILERIAGDLSIDLKILSLAVSKKGNDDTQESRYAKLETVVKYLEKHFAPVIGSVDEPKVYMKGILPMHYSLIPPAFQQRRARIAYFGGSTEHTILGLGGSPKHIIGRISSTGIGEPSSDLPSLAAYLAEELGLAPRNEYYEPEWGLAAVEVMERQMKGQRTKFEFLTKFLLDDSDSGRIRRSKRIVLGTPLYVAYAE